MQTMNRRKTWQIQLEVRFVFSFLALTVHFLVPHSPFHTYGVRTSHDVPAVTNTGSDEMAPCECHDNALYVPPPWTELA